MREQIINAARLKDPGIGHDAMIATGEHGYWIGSIYVSKQEVAQSAREDAEANRNADRIDGYDRDNLGLSPDC